MAGKVEFLPGKSDRALIVGHTGSGKTVFAAWLIRAMNSPFIIYDTKIEPGLDSLGPIVESMDRAVDLAKEKRRVIFRPPITAIHDPAILDSYLLRHYDECKGIGIYLDETYMFQKNGMAGVGLMGVLTRGRSRKIATIMSTQRPVLISRFCVTESQFFYMFGLTDTRDWMRLGDVVPGIVNYPKPPPYHSLFYSIKGRRILPVLPAPLPPPAIKKIRRWY